MYSKQPAIKWKINLKNSHVLWMWLQIITTLSSASWAVYGASDIHKFFNNVDHEGNDDDVHLLWRAFYLSSQDTQKKNMTECETKAKDLNRYCSQIIRTSEERNSVGGRGENNRNTRVRISFIVLPASSLPIPAASMTTRQEVRRWRA